MALSERDRGRLRSVLDAVLRADDVVMSIADERAVGGDTADDADLDALHETLTAALDRLEKLLAGR